MDRDPEARLKRQGDDLEHHLDQLQEHIDNARRTAQSSPSQPDVAGDWEEVHDESGGESPEGAGEAKDDPVR